ARHQHVLGRGPAQDALAERGHDLAAGPFFNFILSAVIFATLALTQGVASDKPLIADVAPTGQAYGAGLRGGDEIVAVDNAPVDSLTQFFTLMNEAEGVPRDVVVRRDGSETVLPVAFSRPPVVATVLRDSAAERACLKPGDVILQVNGEPITQFSDLQTVVGAAGEEPLSFQIQRDADIFERVIQPKYDESVDPITGEFVRRPLIGITARADIGLSGGREQLGPIEAVGHGVTTIGQVITTTLTYLGAILDGRASGAALSGPIGIAKASAEAASVGLLYYVSLVALVSTAIGFLNLLPVPILDGGHLVFYSIEAVWGRPLPERWVGTAMQVGLALLLSLMVFATWNDISPSVTWVSDSLSGTAVDCDAGVGVQ
ncbi:MAG: RIP metalloprotease RseP, partial [Pseudomonadota bacterium]